MLFLQEEVLCGDEIRLDGPSIGEVCPLFGMQEELSVWLFRANRRSRRHGKIFVQLRVCCLSLSFVFQVLAYAQDWGYIFHLVELESSTKPKKKKATYVSNALMECLYLGSDYLAKVRSNRLHTLLDHILHQDSGIEVLVQWSQAMGKTNSESLQVSSICGRLITNELSY
jgi:hypothetical protein